MGETFHFGPFTVEVARRELRRAGVPVALGGRAFDVLVALLRGGGEIVSKEALVAAVWAGAAVEDNAIAAQVAALRRALGEGAEGARWVHTVSGRGYRFATFAQGRRGPERPALPSRLGRKAWLPAALVAGGIALAALVAPAAWRAIRPPPAPWSAADPRMTFTMEKPTLGDASLSPYAAEFARGLAARFRPQFGDAKLLPAAGRANGAPRYAVLLDVRRQGAGAATRVTLVERVNGTVLAVAETADGSAAAPAAEAIWRASDVVKVAAVGREAELARAKPPTKRDARDLYILAENAWLRRVHDDQAIAWLETAVPLAPTQPRLRALLAQELERRVRNGHAAAPERDLDRAVALAEGVLRDDPDDIFARRALTDSFFLEGRWDDAIVAADRTLAIKPDDTLALIDKAKALLAQAEFGPVEGLLARAQPFQIRQDDLDIAELGGLLRFHERRWGEAASFLRRALQLAPPDGQGRSRNLWKLLYLAAAEAARGRNAEARRVLAVFRADAGDLAGPAAFWEAAAADHLGLTDQALVDKLLAPIGWAEPRAGRYPLAVGEPSAVGGSVQRCGKTSDLDQRRPGGPAQPSAFDRNNPP